MNLRKTVARVAALALLATPVAVIASGEAAEAAPASSGTTSAIQPISGAITYGTSDTVSIYGRVSATDGSYVDNGTVTLQAAPYPYTRWTSIATSTNPSYADFDGLKPTISTAYRIVYSGYKTTNDYDETYTSSISKPVIAPVARKLTIKHKGLKMWGTVKPASKLKLHFKIKKGHKYKKWFTVKTNKKGKWTKHIHGKPGTKFVVVLPSSGGYAGAADAYVIY
ncbi:hypothetical protein [Nocardioides sp. Iso805N]|uniref:hypothetical protein n=1 Tax=Nocardioides sp. Iso805N TaxID=1283287 RepID=UPI00035FFF53|nr:hypothetical protein [Nocardioides sp. Iso805N]